MKFYLGYKESTRFVRRARDLGFTLEDIRALLALWQDRARASAQVRRLALDHVADLRGRIAALEGMARTLEDLAAHCGGDARPDCPILDDLAAGPQGAPRDPQGAPRDPQGAPFDPEGAPRDPEPAPSGFRDAPGATPRQGERGPEAPPSRRGKR